MSKDAKNDAVDRLKLISGHLLPQETSSEPKIVPEEAADEVTYKAMEIWHNSLDTAFDQSIPEKEREQKMMGYLNELLHDDVVFKPPTYWKTRKGKMFASFALLGVTKVFKDFKYTRKFLGKRSMALEFTCKVGDNGPGLRGVDLVTLDDDGKVTEFEVVARPPNAVMKLLEYQSKYLIDKGIIKPKK